MIPTFFQLNRAVKSSDPYRAQIVSLIHFQGTNGATNFTDETGKTWDSVTNASISNEQAKWGATSWKQTSSTDSKASYSTSNIISTSSTPFTIEAWIYITGTAQYGHAIFSASKNSGGGEQEIYVTDAGLLSFYRAGNWTDGAAFTLNTSAGAVVKNQWQLVAATFDGSKIRLFVNGIKLAEGNTTAGWCSYGSPPQYIGHCVIPSYSQYRNSLVGYIGDFRITAACRYTADYSIPTEQF